MAKYDIFLAIKLSFLDLERKKKKFYTPKKLRKSPKNKNKNDKKPPKPKPKTKQKNQKPRVWKQKAFYAGKKKKGFLI